MTLKKNAAIKAAPLKGKSAAFAKQETDEDLGRMEQDIRKLKIEYEQYFGGGKKKPPTDVEWRIEQIMKRYGDRGAEMNYGQRFRYSNLSQTFVKYKEIFHKRMRKREEGTVDRHYGAAARAIEAERARLRKPERPPPATGPGAVAIRCQRSRAGTGEGRADLHGLPASARTIRPAHRSAFHPKAFEQFLQRKVAQRTASRKADRTWKSSSAWKAARPG